jgi:hypothetical protein
VQIPLIQMLGEFGVQTRRDPYVWWYHLLLEHKQHFQQSSYPSGRFAMTQVSFNSTNNKWLLCGPALRQRREDIRDRFQFLNIASLRTSTVRLNVTHIEWVYASLVEDFPIKKGLSACVGVGDGHGIGRMISSRAQDDSKYVVVIRFGILKPFHHNGGDSIATAVTICLGIPCFAGIGSFCEEMPVTETRKRIRVGENIHSSGNDGVDFAAPKSCAGGLKLF